METGKKQRILSLLKRKWENLTVNIDLSLGWTQRWETTHFPNFVVPDMLLEWRELHLLCARRTFDHICWSWVAWHHFVQRVFILLLHLIKIAHYSLRRVKIRKNLKSVPTVKFEFWTSDPTCFSWEHGETIVPRRFRTKISLTMVSHTVSQVLVQTVSHGSKKWKVMAGHRRRSAAKAAPLNSSQKALFRGCG